MTGYSAQRVRAEQSQGMEKGEKMDGNNDHKSHKRVTFFSRVFFRPLLLSFFMSLSTLAWWCVAKHRLTSQHTARHSGCNIFVFVVARWNAKKMNKTKEITCYCHCAVACVQRQNTGETSGFDQNWTTRVLSSTRQENGSKNSVLGFDLFCGELDCVVFSGKTSPLTEDERQNQAKREQQHRNRLS